MPITELLVLVWAAVVVVVHGVAVARRARMDPAGWRTVDRPVVLVRPCAGDEAGLEARLASSGSGWDVVRIVVASEDDAAVPAAERAVLRLRAVGAHAVLQVVPTDAPNRKAAQLEAIAEAWPGAILCNVDSDVDMRGVDRDALLGPLCGDEPVACVWAPPVEAPPPETFGDRVSHALLDGSLHAFPLLAALDPAGMVGKVFAVRLDRMEAAGGLGEDMEIARRIRASGQAVHALRRPVRAAPRGRSLDAVVERYARWFAVIRLQRPALLTSYPMLFGATTPLVMLTLALGHSAAAAGVLASRLVVGLVARWTAGGPLRAALLDIPLADAVVWWAFLRTITRREVSWRGRRLRLGAGRISVVGASDGGP
jgi:ceramide glucosyltransferase